MFRRSLSWICWCLVLLPAAPLLGDGLGGHDAFLCAVLEVSRCTPEEGCARVALADLNIPDFVEIDLAAKLVRTTAASGENRSTPVLSAVRQEGLIFLQGVEKGRAWSFVLDEESGRLTAAVAREELSVNAFASCTPLSHP
ncbi:MAG TPA: hypothetical protein VMW27_10715 [Thermoanaerobaculia bacterium]|nr:hypothetical protein [Thermoanaerobaculia bacterium]